MNVEVPYEGLRNRHLLEYVLIELRNDDHLDVCHVDADEAV